jgi:pyrroloquinoline quinone (PQQ) biosynthesis protein C
MNSDIEAAASLERRILAAVAAWPFERTRFYRLLQSGRCPKAVLQNFALSTYRGAEDFCGKLAGLVAAAPDAAARGMLLENLLEEEGIATVAGRGLIVRPETRHVALALRFVRASGLEASPAPDNKGDAVTTLLDDGRWLEAIAFLLVGQEHPFAGASALLYDALLEYRYSPRDLAFFALHRGADEEHGKAAMETVIRRATTPDLQDAVVAAAAGGARQWVERHGGLAGDVRATA